MEVYGKQLKEENQTCFVVFLGFYACDLYYVFDALFWNQ